MKVAFVTSDWGRAQDGSLTPGGAGWVRIVQPAHWLAQRGHETVVGAAIAQGADGYLVPLNRLSQPLMVAPEIIVIQRWMNEVAPSAIAAARQAGQVVVNDVDDYFHGLHPDNAARRVTDPEFDPRHNRDHYLRAMQQSTVVTVSTPYLADRYRRMGVECVVIRNAIDPALFTRQPVRREGPLTIGWCGALAWRSGDLETLRDVLPRWCAANGARFVHHGVMRQDRSTAADRIGLPAEAVGPSRPIATVYDYPDNVAGFDIGVAPLSKIPFNRAKSAIKVMEYAAAGIPAIGTALDEYRWWGSCLTASRPREWLAALDRLADPDERERVAAAGLERVAEHDFRHRITDWEDVYGALLAGPRTATG